MTLQRTLHLTEPPKKLSKYIKSRSILTYSNEPFCLQINDEENCISAGRCHLVREPVVQNHFPRHDSGTMALFVLHASGVGFCCAYSLPLF